MAIADYDNDGNPDILLSGLSSDGVTPLTQVWRNSGKLTFPYIMRACPGVYFSGVAWGDFDNDGRPDILLSGLLVDGVTPVTRCPRRNSGNGTFSNLNATLPGVFGSSVAWADFDQTGKLGFFMMGRIRPVSFPSFSKIILQTMLQTRTRFLSRRALCKSTISSNGVVLKLETTRSEKQARPASVTMCASAHTRAVRTSSWQTQIARRVCSRSRNPETRRGGCL